MNYFEIIRRRRESVCNNKCEPIELMHDYVSSVLESHDLQMCQTVYLSLVNHDYQKGHIYEDEVRRLQAKIDEMNKAIGGKSKYKTQNYAEWRSLNRQC